MIFNFYGKIGLLRLLRGHSLRSASGFGTMGPIEELLFFDESNSWPSVFMKIRIDATVLHDYSLKVSKRPEFKNRNRYGDVSPYDYSRVCLVKNNIDYINASLVKYEGANRAYILTQGPLPGTSGHFWLMVWEQKSRAILMLNKIIEKGHVKCHQYFPTGDDEDRELLFDDVGLKVTFVEELESNRDFAVRVLRVENVETSESVQVMQFHYVAWPDFGVPESPSAFLDFLFAVRSFGVLDDAERPPIIHCSAGIGRSGTFCLADTCLVLIEKEGSVENLKVLDILMEMRKCRMGLIQTHEQLRFSYLAIVEGALRVDCLSQNYVGYFQQDSKDGSEEVEEAGRSTPDGPVVAASDIPESSDFNRNNEQDDLPPVPPRSSGSLSHKTHPVASETTEDEESSPRCNNGWLIAGGGQELQNSGTNELHEIKRRRHEDRVTKTRDMVERMRKRQQASECPAGSSKYGVYVFGGLSLAVAFVGYAAYKFLYGSP